MAINDKFAALSNTKTSLPPYNYTLISGIERNAGAHIHRITNYITGYNCFRELVEVNPTEKNINRLLDYESKLQSVYVGLILWGKLNAFQTESFKIEMPEIDGT